MKPTRPHLAYACTFATAILSACHAGSPSPTVRDSDAPPGTTPTRLPAPPDSSSPTNRQPDPPRPSLPPSPPPTTSPKPPSTAPSPPEPPTAPAAPSLEFHIQVSTQEHVPAARGLGSTLRYPSPQLGLPIFHDRVIIVYEWRPDDGKEKQANPRTGKPWGEIWRPTLAEMMETENLTRFLNTMPAWLDTWVPRNFRGVVCMDIERYPLKSDDFYLGPGGKQELARRAPGRTQADLMREFIRVIEARARQLRPNVAAWGWWGMGGIHAGWTFWNPDDYAKWKRDDAPREGQALSAIQAPMPEFYFPSTFPDPTERSLAWQRAKENWVAMYGPHRLSRDGYAYLNMTHSGPPRDGEMLTRAEFHECLEQARSLGMRRFVVWGVINSPTRRDQVQKFMDEVIVPEVREATATSIHRQGENW